MAAKRPVFFTGFLYGFRREAPIFFEFFLRVFGAKRRVFLTVFIVFFMVFYCFCVFFIVFQFATKLFKRFSNQILNSFEGENAEISFRKPVYNHNKFKFFACGAQKKS